MPLADSSTVAERVRTQLDSLTPSERRAARALLAAYPVLGLDTVASFAAASSVSGPTVVRLVKSLGFGSFREFQDALREEVRSRGESALSQSVRAQATDLGTAGALVRARDAYVRGIDRTFAALHERDAERFVAALADPRRRVVSVGGPYSAMVADYLVRQLAPVRPNVLSCPENAVLAAATVRDIRPDRDLWVVFDVRRYQPAVERLAREAAARRAEIALVTDRWLSPIASIAEVVLTCDVEASGPSDTLVPALALVEALCERAVEQLGEPGLGRLGEVDPIRQRIQ